ncbi:hypothetical protein DASC09_045800 [Saccharomycopsis crataegensis]|uniref:Uncharacterized protein n=1 Tax=Saccharomycopsis crataegensis TaxID=43959 RepID=A0AAV5QQP1_9ASCO|nr:hypothetical protein DASC09_045800 [Saccharomycopsis crataegensis]
MPPELNPIPQKEYDNMDDLDSIISSYEPLGNVDHRDNVSKTSFDIGGLNHKQSPSPNQNGGPEKRELLSRKLSRVLTHSSHFEKVTNSEAPSVNDANSPSFKQKIMDKFSIKKGGKKA